MAVVRVGTGERVLWCITCDTFLGIEEPDFTYRLEAVAEHQQGCQPTDLRWLSHMRIVARIEGPA